MFIKGTIRIAKIFAWVILVALMMLWITRPWLCVSFFMPLFKLELHIASDHRGIMVREIVDPSPKFKGLFKCSILGAAVEWVTNTPIRRLAFGLRYSSGRPYFGEGRFERVLIVPHWLLALATSVAPAWMLAQGKRRTDRQRRLDSGGCIECGYDLRGIIDRCPECGHPVSSQHSYAPRSEPWFVLSRLIGVRDRARKARQIRNVQRRDRDSSHPGEKRT
jgi:hypothetical protein